MSSKNIADETAKTRKILAKNQAWKFSSNNVKKMELLNVNAPIIGENAVLCLVGPFGANQYTLCHPIGITDLQRDDWVLIPTDEIPATLSRMKDPNAEEVNKKRAAERNAILVKAKLLVQKKENGSVLLYYPVDPDNTRNTYLAAASAKQKGELGPLKKELDSLGKGSGGRAQELNTAIQKAKNILNYLPEKVRDSESSIHKYLDQNSVEEMVANKHPYTHRTLVGPYGDTPQRAITGARGIPLADVIGALNKHFACLDLSAELRTKVPKKKRSGRGKGKAVTDASVASVTTPLSPKSTSSKRG